MLKVRLYFFFFFFWGGGTIGTRIRIRFGNRCGCLNEQQQNITVYTLTDINESLTVPPEDEINQEAKTRREAEKIGQEDKKTG